jgi:hypothetical protein
MKTTPAGEPNQPPAPTDRAERRLEAGGWDLSVAVAEALGWQEVRFPGDSDDDRWKLSSRTFLIGTHPSLDTLLPAPSYHEDETACFRDLVPILADAGYSLSLHHDRRDSNLPWTAYLEWSDRDIFSCYGRSGAEAICKVFLVVMKPAAAT